MALNFVVQPTDIQPAYNNIIFIVDSTNKEQDNFNYIADIYIYLDGVKTRITRKKIFPTPIDKLMRLDISRELQNYVSYVRPNLFNEVDGKDAHIEYEVDVFESYVPSLVVNETIYDVSPDEVGFLVTSSTGYVVGELIRFTPTLNSPPIPFFNEFYEITAVTPTRITIGGINLSTAEANIQDYININGILDGFLIKRTSFVTFFEDSIITSDKRIAFNGAFDINSFTYTVDINNNISAPNYGYDFITDNSDAVAISKRPINNIRVKPWQNALFLNFFNFGDNVLAGDFKGIVIKSYNSTGTLIQSRYKETLFPLSNICTMNVSPMAVANGTTLLTGVAGDFITSDVSYYTVVASAPAWSSEQTKIYRFYLDYSCNFSDEYEVVFLDRLGSIHSFVMGGKSTTNFTTDRTFTKSLIGNLETTSTDIDFFGFNQFETSERPLSVILKETVQLSTSWLTNEENEYFQELLSSPLTWIKLKDSQFFIPVKIKTGSWEKKKIQNNSNLKYTIDFAVNNNKIINW